MNSLSTLRLSSRLALGFGLVLALLLALATVSLISLTELAGGLRTITEVNAVRSASVHEMESAVNHAVIGMRNLAITEDGQEELVEYKRLLDALGRYDAAEQLLQKQLASGGGASKDQALFDKARQSATKARDIVKRAQQEIQTKGGTLSQIAFVIRLQLRTELAKWNELQYAWSSDLRALNALVTETSQAHSRRLDQMSTHAQVVVVAVAVLALALGSVASFVITRSVTGPVAEAVAVAQKIARGELEQPVSAGRRDEVGHLLSALEDMRSHLHQLARQLHAATGQIATASAEIAAGNMDLSGRTEQTSASLQGAASAMEELTGTVQHSASSAVHANDLAQSASSVAARGGAVVNDLVRTMDGIDASSKKIGDIIGVIDGIAFQTNILALNAAVEAARAGEQGRGFAVVASEVRSLAQRSAQAAKEIKVLISASVSQVHNGTQFAKDAGATMVEVVGAVDRVANIIGEITTATSQQSEGLSRVNKAVADVDRMTQQNAALVEESAAAASSLQDQAVGLSALVAVFKLSDGVPATGVVRG